MVVLGNIVNVKLEGGLLKHANITVWRMITTLCLLFGALTVFIILGLENSIRNTNLLFLWLLQQFIKQQNIFCVPTIKSIRLNFTLSSFIWFDPQHIMFYYTWKTYFLLVHLLYLPFYIAQVFDSGPVKLKERQQQIIPFK